MAENVKNQEQRVQNAQSNQRLDTKDTAVRPNDIEGYKGIDKDREELVVADKPVERSPQVQSANTQPSNPDADKLVHAGEHLTNPVGEDNPNGNRVSDVLNTDKLKSR